jgi:hypothetical protein
MARPKTPQSDLNELLKLLRRIVVLAVAAFSLAKGMPYLPLLLRLAILWAVLYIASGIVDVVFRRLYHRAMIRMAEQNAADDEKTSAVTVPSTETA